MTELLGKAVIYKALHKGDVNYTLMATERSTSVRIAEPLRNEDKLIDKQPIPEKKYVNNSTCEDC